MNLGRIAAIGTVDEIIEAHGSGERLEIYGTKKLADYIKANTDLKVEYRKGIISIQLNQKIDALAALAAAEQSKLDWGEIHTRRDSLDDVFIKLVSGRVDEQGEIIAESKSNNTNS
jgi:ABC-type multidrug transport system ATPase subunit